MARSQISFVAQTIHRTVLVISLLVVITSCSKKAAPPGEVSLIPRQSSRPSAPISQFIFNPGAVGGGSAQSNSFQMEAAVIGGVHQRIAVGSQNYSLVGGQRAAQ